jgi:hypothetical protein
MDLVNWRCQAGIAAKSTKIDPEVTIIFSGLSWSVRFWLNFAAPGNGAKANVANSMLSCGFAGEPKVLFWIPMANGASSWDQAVFRGLEIQFQTKNIKKRP